MGHSSLNTSAGDGAVAPTTRRTMLRRLGSAGLAGEVAARLGVRATPFAVAVDREGVVAVGLPRSGADIADLAAKCRGPEAQLRTASI